MQKRVLVTGGTGSIGSAIVAELLANHYQVDVLCRSQQSAEKVPAPAKVIMGDISAPQQWAEHIQQIDVLIHTACGFAEDMGSIDRQFLQAVAAQAALRSEPLLILYTTGCWTFGNQPDIINEQSVQHAIHDFQWMLDNSSWLATQPQIRLRRVSPANVVSQEQQFAMPILHWELERHGQPTIPDIANLAWPLVERRDLARLYRLVLEQGEDGEEYIGCASHIPAVTLAGRLADNSVKRVAISDWFATYGTWTEGYGLHQKLCSEKARTNLGWQPEFSGA